MNEYYQTILLALIAGITIPLGGYLAKVEKINSKWLETEFRHSVIAFGGGALLAAVSLVLVPEGIKHFSPLTGGLLFILGGIVMSVIDRKLEQSGKPLSNLIAMMSDYIPEALALGAVIGTKSEGALLLALLIGLQNMPEGFNAYREMIQAGKLSSKKILALFFAAAALGPIAAIIGLGLLSSRPATLGGIMLFAAGAILYLVFQDVAPQAKIEKRWGPALGAVFGFSIGLIGEMVLST